MKSIFAPKNKISLSGSSNGLAPHQSQVHYKDLPRQRAKQNSISRIGAGFTLIELILYIAIASILIVFSSVFIQSLMVSKTKNQTMMEVEEQGVQTLDILTQVIRNAQNINSPSAGESAAELSLAVDDPSKSPAVFDVSQNTLRLKEGNASAVSLTGNRVRVSGVEFRNLSRPGTPGIIRVQLTLSSASTGLGQEYQYSKTFYASAALR